MIKYNARDLLKLSTSDIAKMPNVLIEVTFDDGVDITTTRRLWFARYSWTLHEMYPETPLLISHSMGMNNVESKEYSRLLNNAYRSLYMTYMNKEGFNREEVWRLIYQVANKLYNYIVAELGEYVETIDLEDILGVVLDPRIVEITNNIKPTQESIDDAYDKASAILMYDENPPESNLINVLRCKILDVTQANQTLIARGYTTEINSRIYNEPITVSYARGFRSLYDSAIDSRQASKALMFAKDPLAECEYYNRKLQLVSQTMDNLWHGDCGSVYFLPWLVEHSEMKTLFGQFYLTEEEHNNKEFNKLRWIEPKDKHLVGSTIYLRTPFGCTHPDRQTVCSTCYGLISANIPNNTNPGHASGIELGEKVSQLVLKTKHVDGMTTSDDIEIDEEYIEYIKPGADGRSLRFGNILKGSPLKIIIPQEAAKELPDVEHIPSFIGINVYRITEIKTITMIIGDNVVEDMQEIEVPICIGSRLSSITIEGLQYIKEVGFELTDNGDYIIDLGDWNINTSFFTLPLKHVSMIDYKDEVESILFSQDKKNGLSSKATTTEAVKGFLSLVSSKLNINLSHILMMSYCMSAVNPKAFDYRPPRGGEEYTFVTMHQLMQNRSLGALMAYQGQEKAFIKPESYVIRNRTRHPMDAIVMG